MGIELVIGLVLSAFAAIATTAASISNNQNNINAQQQANQKNEELTRESWARDDNAVQRRKADLIAAGLSPVLAAGSSAGNTNPITVNAVKSDAPDFSKLMDFGNITRNFKMDYLMKQQQLETGAANLDLLKEQTTKYQQDVLLDRIKALQGVKESNARIADMSFNQTYKNNHLDYMKEVQKWNEQIQEANYELQVQDRLRQADIDEWYWLQGMAPGSPPDLFSKFGIGRIGGVAHEIANRLSGYNHNHVVKKNLTHSSFYNK